MKVLFWGSSMALLLLLTAAFSVPAAGGETTPGLGDYKLLDPITHHDLTIFPVVAARSHDTSVFITLDEGIRSGDVVITETGNLHGGMVRRRPTHNYSGAQVNRLVLVNNSKRPLLLLAGEVVTGGKQDRVVAKDRIVPPESDPVDLGVFCVEPGRWIENSTKFDTHASVMVQPSVRKQAMAEANQQKVWDSVNAARGQMAAKLAAEPSVSGHGSGGDIGGVIAGNPAQPPPAPIRELHSTTSYAKVIENSAVKQQMDQITEPMQKQYESVIKRLKDQNAVGVVVAVKGRIVWADLFASSSLLGKYWPKLLQSYAAESLTSPGTSAEPSKSDAEKFLANWQARHEVVDSEPGLYRQRELVGDRFRAFELTSLLNKASFDVHLSKMAE
jgi:ARG/rhodanese/phosphatase superfamily protein